MLYKNILKILDHKKESFIKDLDFFLQIDSSNPIKNKHSKINFCYEWLKDIFCKYGLHAKAIPMINTVPAILVQSMINGDTRPSIVIYTGYDSDINDSFTTKENKIYTWSVLCFAYILQNLISSINFFWVIDSDLNNGHKEINTPFNFGTFSTPMNTLAAFIMHNKKDSKNSEIIIQNYLPNKHTEKKISQCIKILITNMEKILEQTPEVKIGIDHNLCPDFIKQTFVENIFLNTSNNKNEWEHIKKLFLFFFVTTMEILKEYQQY